MGSWKLGAGLHDGTKWPRHRSKSSLGHWVPVPQGPRPRLAAPCPGGQARGGGGSGTAGQKAAGRQAAPTTAPTTRTGASGLCPCCWRGRRGCGTSAAEAAALASGSPPRRSSECGTRGSPCRRQVSPWGQGLLKLHWDKTLPVFFSHLPSSS